MKLNWTDSLEIAISLDEKFPDIDPQYIRFTDLLSWVIELEDFDGEEDKSGEKILEAIQMAWIEDNRCRQDIIQLVGGYSKQPIDNTDIGKVVLQGLKYILIVVKLYKPTGNVKLFNQVSYSLFAVGMNGAPHNGDTLSSKIGNIINMKPGTGVQSSPVDKNRLI